MGSSMARSGALGTRAKGPAGVGGSIGDPGVEAGGSTGALYGRCDRPPTSSRNANAPATARYRTQSCGMPLEDAWSFDRGASSSSPAYLPPTS